MPPAGEVSAGTELTAAVWVAEEGEVAADIKALADIEEAPRVGALMKGELLLLLVEKFPEEVGPEPGVTVDDELAPSTAWSSSESVPSPFDPRAVTFNTARLNDTVGLPQVSPSSAGKSTVEL